MKFFFLLLFINWLLVSCHKKPIDTISPVEETSKIEIKYTVFENALVRFYLNLKNGDHYEFDLGDGEIIKGNAIISNDTTKTILSHQYKLNKDYTVVLKIKNGTIEEKKEIKLKIGNKVPSPIADFSYEFLDNGRVKIKDLSKNASVTSLGLQSEKVFKFEFNRTYKFYFAATNKFGETNQISKNITIINAPQKEGFVEFKGLYQGKQVHFIDDGVNFESFPSRISINIGFLLRSVKDTTVYISVGYQNKKLYSTEVGIIPKKEAFELLKNEILTTQNDPRIIDTKVVNLDPEIYDLTDYYPQAIWVTYRLKDEKLDGVFKIRYWVSGKL